jgi:hypothetical protein
MLCDVLVYEKFRPMIFLEMSDIRCTKKGWDGKRKDFGHRDWDSINDQCETDINGSKRNCFFLLILKCFHLVLFYCF